MIPSKVFVGDRASLVLELKGLAGLPAEEINPTRLPSSPNIDIHRAALERRPNGNRLTIEFSAYAPGILELPSVSIGGETFSGLTVEISSILEADTMGMVLSNPALPLAIPGTSLLLYGTIGAAVLALLLILWTLVWGRRQMKDWIEAWKRWQLVLAMWRIEKRLRRDMARGSAEREILDTLSAEFRSFLSYFSGKSCRAMTACEFDGVVFFEEYHSVPGGEFLGSFFNRCDGIRFSGSEIGNDAAQSLLGEIRSFLRTLDRAMRKKVLGQRQS
ncbi:MAG: hypothetical protein FWG46_00235 [Treponema sp.]|nr:hypothetical protein [Treponema sp.]